MSYQQYPGYPPQPARRTNPWLIGCLIALGIVVLAFGGCAVLVGVAANKAAHSTIAPAAPTVAGTAPGGKAAPKAAGVGNAVKDGKFTFTVTAVKPGPHTIGSDPITKTAQGKFEFVYVTVTNHASEAQAFSGDDQKLLSGGKEYSADTEAAIYVPESQSLFTQINPGNTVKGIVVFDIPTGVVPDAVVLHDSPFSDGVKVTLK